jgi:hypothetical protein|tara:strand:+ start:941 stop:1054 length:114 start_codon:yes stop_codon:yes gene_type:complete
MSFLQAAIDGIVLACFGALVYGGLAYWWDRLEGMRWK